MDKNDILIDQAPVAEYIGGKIRYSFSKHFLVKPLDAVIVTKEFDKPVPASDPKKDENGIEAVDYDKVETEVKEVESDFTRGVVLKVPYNYELQARDEKYPPMEIKCGDVIIFKTGRGTWFDLLKDTKLIEMYDIIAVETLGDGVDKNMQSNSEAA